MIDDKIRQASGPWRVGSRVCVPAVVIGSLRARKGAALGGIRRGNTRAEVPLKSRRSRAAADQPLKNRPKNGIEFRTAFGPQNVAKSIPKSLQKLTSIRDFPVFISVTFSSLFLDEFLLTLIVPDPRFNYYL